MPLLQYLQEVSAVTRDHIYKPDMLQGSLLKLPKGSIAKRARKICGSRADAGSGRPRRVAADPLWEVRIL